MRTLTKLLASLRQHGAALAIVLLCASTGLVHAQTTTGGDSADPPSRVARLSYLAGDLGLLPAGASDWSDASINRPLTTGDRLSSGDDARAELEFGGATLRLDHRTDLGLLNLDEQLAQIELTQGSLNLSVRHLDDGQSYEIDTPTVALVIDQPGRFRVDIDGDATRVTAFEGKAIVYGENNAQREVFAGRSYRFVDSSLAAVAISDIGGGDNFDAWVDQRDQRYAQSRSSEYVSPDVVGYQDLDQYGEWQDSSDYGAVWYPNNVEVGWAPYRDGHWAYIAPWGWTWVDATPWGYAPYHYGRWAHTHRGWGWIPGPRYARPIYAPALVAFVGGGGFSVGISSGPIGWFPLGPGEVYNPWYRSSRDYYRRVNVTNIRVTRTFTNVIINNRINNHYGHYRNNQPLREHYVNRYAPRGFTAISGREFAAGARVQRHLVKVDSRNLESARVMPRGVDVRPAPQRRPVERSEHVRRLPLDGFRREVVAHRAPPAMAERRIRGAHDRIGSQAAVVPVSHVRVLGSNDNARDDRRQATAARMNAERERAQAPRGTAVLPKAPVIERRGAVNEISANEPPARTELRSARFAHPQGRHQAEERQAMPRPGVSYISSARQDSHQRVSRTALPEVPRIESAARSERPTAIRGERLPAEPINQTRPNSFERRPAEPRFERAEVARPAYVREQARPQAIPRESPRPIAQQPRFQSPRVEQPHYQPPQQVQPQRAAAPRVEAPRPQRSTPHKDRDPEPRRQQVGQRQ